MNDARVFSSVRLNISTPEQMGDLGVAVAAHLRAGDLLALNGELGAGKTTFTRGLGRGLGVRGTVTSPTFVLARTHPRPSGAPLVHVDAYRLSSAVELDDLDIDFAGSIVVVEWAEGMLDGVCDSWLDFRIVRPVGASEPPDLGVEGADASASADNEGDDDEQIEPRHIWVRGFGPRWVNLDWLAESSWRT